MRTILIDNRTVEVDDKDISIFDTKDGHDPTQPPADGGSDYPEMPIFSKDDIWGTTESDRIMGTEDADRIYGFGGDDAINASEGNDTVHGGSGRDTIHGGSDDDALYGGADDDQLFGDKGNDVLYGGTGDDAMAGGDGDDVYYVDSGDDAITESAGPGTGHDTVHLSSSFSSPYGAYQMPDNVEELHLGEGVVFEVWGNDGDNLIHGNDKGNIIRDGGGNDTVFGHGGEDYIYAGDGTNLLFGGDGSDTFIVGEWFGASQHQVIGDFTAEDRLWIELYEDSVLLVANDGAGNTTLVRSDGALVEFLGIGNYSSLADLQANFDIWIVAV